MPNFTAVSSVLKCASRLTNTIHVASSIRNILDWKQVSLARGSCGEAIETGVYGRSNLIQFCVRQFVGFAQNIFGSTPHGYIIAADYKLRCLFHSQTRYSSTVKRLCFDFERRFDRLMSHCRCWMNCRCRMHVAFVDRGYNVCQLKLLQAYCHQFEISDIYT